MSKFAIIGYPSRHSLSPALFRAAYPNSEDTYDFIEAPTIEEAMRLFVNMGYKGANITSPFKQEIIQHCDNIDSVVSRCEASNLIIEQNGKIYGYNSDYSGIKSIAENLLADNRICTKAVITGAGGAGRAAALALADLGFEVTILNRTVEKAKAYASRHGISYGALADLAGILSPKTLLVHTIDHQLPFQNEIDLSEITIIEANYKNANLSSMSCNKYISGKEWLIYQAIPAFSILTGSLPDMDTLKKVVE